MKNHRRHHGTRWQLEPSKAAALNDHSALRAA